MATRAHSTPAPESAHHHRTRYALEARIEELIALLDEVDGDQPGVLFTLGHAEPELRRVRRAAR